MPRILPADANFDESRVPPYTLPDPLRGEDGSRVRSASEWLERRRPELLERFASTVYGRTPFAARVAVTEVVRDPRALGGAATHLELDVDVREPLGRTACSIGLSVWIPNGVERAPVMLGLNYLGNQSVHPDPRVRLARGWVPREPEHGLLENVASEASRGAHQSQWPLELAIARGYAVATLYAGDLDPDFDDGFENGVQGSFRTTEQHAPDAWGAIAAWAFGLSRALDALEQLEAVDAARVAVLGHSRLGKAALWAGALDPRFRLVISNCSGAGGASLFRREFGERLHHLTARFPHWFAGNLRAYEHAEAELPVDQHELLALIAPRPLFVGSAEADLWADPYGEYLSLCHAAPVYALFGAEAPSQATSCPAVGTRVGGQAAYERRAGGHGLGVDDWRRYLGFADRWLRSG
jgi:hypothetical protein